MPGVEDANKESLSLCLRFGSNQKQYSLNSYRAEILLQGVDACLVPALSRWPWVLTSETVAEPGAHGEKYAEARAKCYRS